MTKVIINKSKFTSCLNWNKQECPNNHTAIMGLSSINWPYLFLLNDDTGKKLDRLCDECLAYMAKMNASKGT